MALFRHICQRLRFHWRLHRVNALCYGSRGENVQLLNGSNFDPPENITFGSDIYVGPEAYFMADGGIVIGDNVIFGPRVSIFTSNHRVEGVDWLPYGPLTELGEVVIGPNTWVGAYCIILAGVRVGEGAVCAAGSVLTRNVPPLAFVAGNPVEVKRYRDPKQYLKLKGDGRLYMRHKRHRPPQVEYARREPPTGEIAQSPAALEQRRELGLDQYDFQA